MMMRGEAVVSVLVLVLMLMLMLMLAADGHDGLWKAKAVKTDGEGLNLRERDPS